MGLDEPMDAVQNTPLHLAVKVGDVQVVHALWTLGADPALLNARGDSPSQWFGLPRLRAAARHLHGKQVHRIYKTDVSTHEDLGVSEPDLELSKVSCAIDEYLRQARE